MVSFTRELMLLALLCLLNVQFALGRPGREPHKNVAWNWPPKHGGKMSQGVLRHSREARKPGTAATRRDSQAASIVASKVNVWESLTDEEAASVVGWMFGQDSLNLTTESKAGAWDNTLMLVELQIPNKTDVLHYLDKNGTAPPRYAHAVISVRATEEPYFQELLVGPLPIDDSDTSYRPLSHTHTRDDDGKVRNLEADSALHAEWISSLGVDIADVTMDLWGIKATGEEGDELYAWSTDPYWQEDGRVLRWDSFWRLPNSTFDSTTLLPMGLYVCSDITGRDPSRWTVEGWSYNNVWYESTDEFVTAYWAGEVEKLPAAFDGNWTHTDPQGEPLPLDDKCPPSVVAPPSGARFAVDYANNYVEWMGFGFYMGFSRARGVALYDVRYDGQRIMYELGPQEALAHYAGGDPFQSSTAYLDSYYGLGASAVELVPGHDCPGYATFLNTTLYDSQRTHTRPATICLFEYPDDYPLQRHTGSSGYVASSTNTRFSVRSVSTVGNYDYMFTYTFRLDASLAVDVRASGYIQAAYHSPSTNGPEYGFAIHDALSGGLHDHVLHYKADLDILGTANSAHLLTVAPLEQTYPWSRGKTRSTMHLLREPIPSESSSRLDWAPNSASQLLIVNTDNLTKYGEPRGYRLMPITPPAHLTVRPGPSSNLVNAANWASTDLAITVHHDAEACSAHPLSMHDTHSPPVDFAAFFDDDEALGQEDLVVWFNLGMHHVPTTGDLPNTLFTGSHAGVVFVPSNYFEGDQSRRARSGAVRIVGGDGNGSAVATVTFGQGMCEDGDLLAEYRGGEVVEEFYLGYASSGSVVR